jgi:hypothetical protein
VDAVRKGVRWLQQYRQRKLVVSCSYVQNGTLVENVELTLAHDASTQEHDDIIFDWRDQDFLVSPSHFAEKELAEPQRGDMIIREVDSQQIEYTVSSSGNEPSFRPMSRYHLGWRIHAKRTRRGSLDAST